MTESLVLRRSHGFPLDHIGLGVPDVEEGVRWFSEKTGVEIALSDPEPGQYYWSGGVKIGEDSFLEIVGPNPAWKRFNPILALLQTLEEPQLLFWYVAVSDFAAFQRKARAAGKPVKRVERINVDGGWPDRAGYVRGFLGPGILTQRPNLIEWVKRPSLFSRMPLQCRLTDLRLSHPRAAELTSHLRQLDIDVSITGGPRNIGISLDTPKGELILDNPGLDLRGAGLLIALMGLWFRARL